MARLRSGMTRSALALSLAAAAVADMAACEREDRRLDSRQPACSDAARRSRSAPAGADHGC